MGNFHLRVKILFTWDRELLWLTRNLTKIFLIITLILTMFWPWERSLKAWIIISEGLILKDKNSPSKIIGKIKDTYLQEVIKIKSNFRLFRIHMGSVSSKKEKKIISVKLKVENRLESTCRRGIIWNNMELMK